MGRGRQKSAIKPSEPEGMSPDKIVDSDEKKGGDENKGFSEPEEMVVADGASMSMVRGGVISPGQTITLKNFLPSDDCNDEIKALAQGALDGHIERGLIVTKSAYEKAKK